MEIEMNDRPMPHAFTNREAIPDDATRLMESPAVRAVLQERLAQHNKHQHSAAADAERPLHYLPRKAYDQIHDAMDFMRGCNGPPDLDRAERRLIIAGGLILAALDRLALEKAKSDDNYSDQPAQFRAF
jgi:hypothetical protein